MFRRPPRFTQTVTLFPYTTLFRSSDISVFVELVGELGSTGFDDPATDEHMHVVRLDVAPDPGVVGDEQHAAVLVRLEAVYALGDHAQRVDVEACIGLAKNGDLRLKTPALKDRVAVFYALGEDVVPHIGRGACR